MWPRRAIAVVSLASFLAGCGTTGWIRFQELDPSAETIHQTPTQVYAIDCQDQEIGPPPKPSLASALAAGLGASPIALLLVAVPALIVMAISHPPPPPPRPHMVYVMTCTKDGGAIPWKVIGAFGAGEAALDKWDRYSREVAEKAGARGCPAVLVRRTPPAASSWSEAVGALCVDTEQPSGVSGPMRLVSVRTGPLRVLGDGEAVAER
jgi:hypothetical protein